MRTSSTRKPLQQTVDLTTAAAAAASRGGGGQGVAKDGHSKTAVENRPVQQQAVVGEPHRGDDKTTAATAGLSSSSSMGQTKSTTTGVKVFSAKKRTTRARNGIIKQAEIFSPKNDQPQLASKPRLSSVSSFVLPEQDPLDELASLLASVDKESYSKAVWQDASAIYDHILFPMSCPWTHRLLPSLKVVPHDVDEISGLKMPMQEEEDESVPYKTIGDKDSYAANVLLPRGCQAALRRCEDPGVMEYHLWRPRSLVQDDYLAKTRKEAPSTHDDGLSVQDLSYNTFCRVRKRQREGQDAARVKKQTISIRVGGSSSRKTLRSASTTSKEKPLVLIAEHSRYIREGRELRNPSIDDEHVYLGTYDTWQPYETSNSNRSDNRTRKGRIRLVWSKRNEENVHSLLDGQPISSLDYRRPRTVKVAIRLNGSLLSSTEPLADEEDDDFDEDEREDVIEDALDHACRSKFAIDKPSLENSQCKLDVQKYFAGLERHRCPEEPASITRLRMAIDVCDASCSGQAYEVRVTPPVIDCIPSEEGRISVACTSNGCMAAEPIQENEPSGASVNHSLNSIHVATELMATEMKVCLVCCSSDSGSSVLSCVSCGLTVHQSCYGHRTHAESDDDGWQCDVCSRYASEKGDSGAEVSEMGYIRNRRSTACTCCGLKGGSISQDSKGEWIHDTCRIWNAVSLGPTNVCCLCNEQSGPIIRCAGNACLVSFHPICAMAYSLAFQVRRRRRPAPLITNDFERMVYNDAMLCNQYSMASLCVSSGSSEDGMNIPIGLCGCHNPLRRRDLYGWGPGATACRDSVRVPPGR